jgi:hypothetical protein
VPAATTLLGSQVFAQWGNGGDGSLGDGLPLTLASRVEPAAAPTHRPKLDRPASDITMPSGLIGSSTAHW